MPTLRPVLVAILFLAHAPLLAQGDAPASHQVVATNLVWTPANLTIAPGDTVTFVNGGGTHNFQPEGTSETCALPCTRTYATEGRHPFRCGIHPQMKGLVSVGVAPTVDVAVPADGASVQGLVTVSGTAGHATEAVQMVELRLAGVVVASATPDAAGAWSLAWNSTLTPNGPATLVARAVTAPSGLSSEEAVAVTVANPPEVDLRAISLTGSTTGVVNATLFYTIENGGNVPTGPFALRFEYSYKGTWRPIGDAQVNDLGAFARATGRFVWQDGLHVGRYPVRMTMDPLDAVAETVETNNVAQGSAAFVTPLQGGIDPLDP